MFFDPLYFVLLAPGLLLAAWAQWRMKSAFNEGKRYRASRGITGAQAGWDVMHAAGVGNVGIEPVEGFLSDHYDPSHKVLRLSPDVYQGDSLSAVGVAAHEAGHAMHSWFSTRTQPYPTAGYPIFVAEVASTFNEALLIEQMLREVKEPKARLSLLGNYLEGVKGTVFRQTQFAEFELRIHEMAQKGEPLTGDVLSKVYLDITRKYYGHDQKVSVVDDYVAHEWAYVTHFYRPFYVYQYATSFTASTALAEKVLSGQADAVKRYRTFLAAGGSKYPIELLKDAGVDMTTTEPLDLTIQKMNRVMDEIEKLLKN